MITFSRPVCLEKSVNRNTPQPSTPLANQSETASSSGLLQSRTSSYSRIHDGCVIEESCRAVNGLTMPFLGNGLNASNKAISGTAIC